MSTAKPDIVRDEARRTLESRFWDSLKISLAFLGAATAVATAVGGAFIALQAFNRGVFAWLVWSVVFSGAVALVVLEFRRLLLRSEALERLMELEVLHEAIIADVRRERDEFRLQLTTVAHENASLRNLREFLQVQMAAAMADIETAAEADTVKKQNPRKTKANQ